MLDAFEILTTSGIVLWRKHYAPIAPSIVDGLIRDVFIEEKQSPSNEQYRKERYTLKWSLAKDVGLVFVAVYQSLLHLSWVDNLLTAVKALFVKEYGSEVKTGRTTKLHTSRWDATFDALVTKLDTGNEPPPPPVFASQPKRPAIPRKEQVVMDDTTSADATPIPTPDTSRPATPHLLTAKGGPGGKTSRRARKAQNFATSAPASSGDESAAGKASKVKSTAKAKRRWDVDGGAIDDYGDDATLDYSASTSDAVNGDDHDNDIADVSASQMGSRTGKGQFVLKDLDDEVDAILASSRSQKSQSSDPDPSSTGGGGLLGTATSRLTGLFRNALGGATLTKSSLQQPLAAMRNHLLEKNVAREAADRLCASVETDLLNQKTASFTSIDKTIRESMEKALTRILTPTSSLDLLRDVTTTTTGPSARPYVISIVGVNGVGKSTNLSKIAYFLLQNHFRVLIVAGDTFRSGAVEQLRVHVRNLSELARREAVGRVELFEKGYGKDAASVAKEAVSYASNNTGKGGGEMLYDVVLIDTAGRRHNDTRLMSSLTKFGQLANPDKIFMVGEALVGSDSVAQARNFAKEFVDTKGNLRNNGVGMDGFIISKCDTVGDMVGTLVSMVHATGIPVVFLGVGQHYGDLRGLNVGWAVERLMR
ncbi:hypothetical protein BAUCODRAFT_73744 [Baudoinia panamericana UAMH 10762]|uniref:Signal recognition particle receptor subunit alpha homolog n=1 Tax=Baudoinia panamericana (strain UAMH 10762) TaxID=717646 RepID=M2ME50_BAUPA|nr:uncharacterized protein BAUCODRAFT_73744 [Baudoinia panamericana UAMH 10762]EMC94861.1 hypothetical protein BAUCODRAFT_73744 [Baudoinia panamericana UAMH 10762]